MTLSKIEGSIDPQPVNDNYTYLDEFIKNVIQEHIGYGLRTGLTVSAQDVPDMSVHVDTGVAYLPLGRRANPSAIDLTVSNPSTVQHINEPHTTDSSGVFSVDLIPVTDSNGNLAATGDIIVTKVSDGTSVTVDSIDPATGQVTTSLTSATDVEIDYFHGQERIDIVDINTDSENNIILEVIQGTPANSNPSPPSTPSGAFKLAELSVIPKSTISIESTDITNVDNTKGIYLDSNYNLVVKQDLVVEGAQSTGEVTNEDLIVRNRIYNDDTGEALKVDDDLYVTGDITLDGTIGGSNINNIESTLNNHIAKEVDTTSTSTTKDKHVSDSLAKGWEDHRTATGNVHSIEHSQLNNILQVDTASTDTTKNKHISNSLAKAWQDHIDDNGTYTHLTLGETSSTAYRGDRGKTAYNHAISTGNAHSMDHADLNTVVGVNTGSTSTTKTKHVSDSLAKGWEDHRTATGNPHNTQANQISISDSEGNFDAGNIEDALAEEANARQSHENNTFNPHNVSPSQIGASPSGHNHDSRYPQANFTRITVSSTAPSSPVQNDLWVDIG